MKINAKDTQARTTPVSKQTKHPKKKRRLRARINKRANLVERHLMKPHNFLSTTNATSTDIYPMIPLGANNYEVQDTAIACSVILKLIVKTDQTNPMTLDWSTVLWDITQQDNVLPPNVLVTFTRHFERIDNDLAQKRIRNRHHMAVISSANGKNRKKQSTFVRHDNELLDAIDTGDCVVAFGGEAIISAPDELLLEKAMEAVQNYLRSNDESRGLSYELDINRQLHPFVLYGPNKANKNKDVFVEMTNSDAAISALFVDSGGDRSLGSEYIGVSVGKMIQSHAAYCLQNPRMLLIGNDTINKTYTLMGESMPKGLHDLPSQIYFSHAVSRSYLLEGHSVTHFVLDHMESVQNLMSIPLSVNHKIVVDVAKGLLNILEVVGHGEWEQYPERIVGRFTTHLNNIIALLNQYRDVKEINTNDEFAKITRKILTMFFVSNKYYSYNPLAHLEDIRLVGEHSQYKILADLGGWIAQQRKSNKDAHIRNGLAELDTIINDNILPTIPALNTTTQPIIDTLMQKQYRVIDVTGMNIGSIMRGSDSTTNVMLISYLNLLLPSLANGDVIFFHGFARVSKIANVIQDMVDNCGLQIDIVFTESNQNQALKTKELIHDTLDVTVVDLYNNKVDKLITPFDIDARYAHDLANRQGTFYIQTKIGSDYIYLDNIL